MSQDDVLDLRIEQDYFLKDVKKHCTVGQKTLFKELKQLIKEKHPNLTVAQKKFLTTQTYIRYLRARTWDLDKAEKMLSNTLDWRHEYKPHAITAEDVEPELNNEGKMYRHGFDVFNRPVIYMKPRYDNTKPEEKDMKVKYLVYLVEKSVLGTEKNNREKLTLLIDFDQYSKGTGGGRSIKIAMEVLNVLTNHYPERLGYAIMLNTPWTFSVFWKVIYPFLDDVTRKKIHFIKKNEEILNFIPKDQLEIDYGGDAVKNYSFEKEFQREDQEFVPYDDDGKPLKSFN